MQDILFNDNWEYKEGYLGTKERSVSHWENIQLPHDACIGLRRKSDAPGRGYKGFFPDGGYIYRKFFFVPEEYEGKIVQFFFEGAYNNAVVWINGNYAGQSRNGYVEFTVDAGRFLKYGQDNEIKVSLRTGKDARWYTGAGIYRSVHMLTGNLLHIPFNGLRIKTESVFDDVAALETQVRIINKSLKNSTLMLVSEIMDSNGNMVAEDKKIITVYGETMETASARIYVKRPKLWNIDNPYIYTCNTKLLDGDKVVDYITSGFGIRVLTLDNVYGLRINGEKVKLYGGCIHHDNGIIGSMENHAAEVRKISKLKAAGYNAVRSAHHPMSRTLLDVCDKTGMLVMDELCDMWNEPKTADDFSRDFEVEHEKWLETMITKDYNHPCVIIYSIGNEIPETGKPSGAVISRKLHHRIKELDDTRFTVCSVNGLISNIDIFNQFMAEKYAKAAAGDVNELMTNLGNAMREAQCWDIVVDSTRETMESVDIAGYNYAEKRYLMDIKCFTNRICLGTESVPQLLAEIWELVKNHGNILGDFVWTAWDYLGEAGLGKNLYEKDEGEGFGAAYPYYLANCGDFDIIGERRTQSYYREVVIGKRTEPYIAVVNPYHYGEKPEVSMWSWSDSVSSWNWEGCEGKPVQVEVYSNADEVELFVNDTSCGKKVVYKESNGEKLAFCTRFDTIYQPGTITVIAYSLNRMSGQYVITTAAEEIHPEVVLEKETLSSDSMEMGYILIELRDDNGNLHTNSDRKVTVKVTGSGVLQGLGSCNPVTDECFTSGIYTTYKGKLLAAVRPVDVGTIEVEILCEGCEKVNKNMYVR